MSQKDYDMVPRWYVVHTYSGYENKVKTDLEKTVKNRELEEYFFEIIVPIRDAFPRCHCETSPQTGCGNPFFTTWEYGFPRQVTSVTGSE